MVPQKIVDGRLDAASILALELRPRRLDADRDGSCSRGARVVGDQPQELDDGSYASE
jgi:hypothetical protein